MNGEQVKSKILGFLVFVMFASFVQLWYPFFTTEGLKGAVVLTTDTSFSLHGWWSGAYQTKKEKYLNDNTGFRADLVRLNNQIDFSLFRKIHAREVTLGHNNMLFEAFYLNEYAGKDFLGETEIQKEMFMLKKIQDTLEKMGKTFLFSYASSKAYMFPEDIPDSYLPADNNRPTNYAVFKRIGDSLHINQIDFNAWLKDRFKKSKYPLFTRAGTHWSYYTSVLITDSLIRYVEHERKIQLPRIIVDSIQLTTKPREIDNDLAAGLNLIEPINSDTFAYQFYRYSSSDQYTKLRAIFLGDSYLWTLKDDHLMSALGTDWQIWYYFQEMWTQKSLSGEEPAVPIEQYNWQQKLMNSDCVICIFTPANFKGFNYPGHFIYSFYRYFYPGQG